MSEVTEMGGCVTGGRRYAGGPSHRHPLPPELYSPLYVGGHRGGATEEGVATLNARFKGI